MHPGRLLRALAGAGLFAAALWFLHRELHRYDPRHVMALARATPPARIALALAATAASYLLLTTYDVLALRHVGRRLAWGRIALTSFTSSVTSHNVGFSGLGGSAVRYRLYSAWGLALGEIAEVIAFCSLTFWTGFLTVGGVVFVVDPVELPPSFHSPFRTLQPLGFVLQLTERRQ